MTGSRPGDGRRLKMTNLSAGHAREFTKRTLHREGWICNSSIEHKPFVPVQRSRARQSYKPLWSSATQNTCQCQYDETLVDIRPHFLNLSETANASTPAHLKQSLLLLRKHSPSLPPFTLPDIQEQRAIDARYVRKSDDGRISKRCIVL